MRDHEAPLKSSRLTWRCIASYFALLLPFHIAHAQTAAAPIDEPVLDPPTLHCLGAYWIVRGDANKNAKVEVSYRAAGTTAWHSAMPLFRVERGAHLDEKKQSKLDVPDDAWLFAGSVVMLAPDTAYDLRLNLVDPDGGNAERLLQARTMREPVAPANAPQFHVVPGNGGGSGTATDPYKGLGAAQAQAKPGDIFLVHAGIYEGTFTIDKNGEPGRPIVWRGAGDGEAIIDGQGHAATRAERAISSSETHDVWFEKLTLRNANYAFVGHNSQRLVIRRCHMHDAEFGITCTNNSKDAVRGFFISDNLIEGPSTWPRTKGIEDARGIQVTGTGHEVCYNRIRGFGDGMDTFPSQRCAAIDFHNNDVSECTDDGSEMDYSERNTRNFLNRYTNVFQGVSVQPIFGGPVYIFRNAIYNVVMEPFKMHNSPSGALMLHNTVVKQGAPLLLWTSDKVRNCVYRNNLFIGTTANYAYESTAPMQDCDFDYDGFGGGPFGMFLKWNNVRYATFQQMRDKAPIENHATLVDADTFASGLRPPADEKQQYPGVADLRLRLGSAAIDAGQELPNFDDGYSGATPDLGAYEFGSALPQYGPRPAR